MHTVQVWFCCFLPPSACGWKPQGFRHSNLLQKQVHNHMVHTVQLWYLLPSPLSAAASQDTPAAPHTLPPIHHATLCCRHVHHILTRQPACSVWSRLMLPYSHIPCNVTARLCSNCCGSQLSHPAWHSYPTPWVTRSKMGSL